MKPTLQIQQPRNRRDSGRVARKGSPMPQIEHGYQTGSFGGYSRGGGGGGGQRRSSLREISQDYFASEAPNHFATEAAFFLLIVLTAAVPVFQSICGLYRLVCGVL
ncbi:MAG TPA: hypothetical protein VF551_05645 [Chthoniobacterales bacterium]